MDDNQGGENQAVMCVRPDRDHQGLFSRRCEHLAVLEIIHVGNFQLAVPGDEQEVEPPCYLPLMVLSERK